MRGSAVSISLMCTIAALVCEPPVVRCGEFSAFVWGRYKELVYLDSSGHVHEAFRTADQQPWELADLTALVGAPQLAAVGSNIAGFAWKEYKQVAYLDANGNVHEMSVKSGDASWSDNDLSAIASAPGAAPGSALVAYTWGKYKQIAYLDNAGHIHELYCPGTTTAWEHADLSVAVNAPAATAGSPLYALSLGREKQLAYVNAQGHAQELSCGSGWTAVPPAIISEPVGTLDAGGQVHWGMKFMNIGVADGGPFSATLGVTFGPVSASSKPTLIPAIPPGQDYTADAVLATPFERQYWVQIAPANSSKVRPYDNKSFSLGK